MMSLTDKQKSRVEALAKAQNCPRDCRECRKGLTAADEQLRALIKAFRQRLERHRDKDCKACAAFKQCADELSEYVLPEEASE